MTHVTCRLTAKNRDQLRNPTLGSRAWATFFSIEQLRRSVYCTVLLAASRAKTMDQQQQQPAQVSSSSSSHLPPGVQDVYISYGMDGRPRVNVTLQDKPRRQLMAFSVVLLIFGPLIVGLVGACMAMQHYFLAYGFAAGILVSIPS